MKIRQGFVSNSSSSSFILISKEKLHRLTKKERDNVRTSYVPISFGNEIRYGRSDIMKLSSIKDKAAYIIAMYCLATVSKYSEYNQLPEYLDKAYALKDKLMKLGDKHGYLLTTNLPPMYFTRETDRYNEETRSFEDCEPYYITHIAVNTEAEYLDDIVKMVESNSDKLERFIFNPHSFAILGGDEYSQTDDLAFEARKEVDYDYDFISDNKTKDNWGKIKPYYYDNESIPYWDSVADAYEQENLPFNGDEDDD